MPNGKNTPDCHNCKNYSLVESEPGSLASLNGVTIPFCLLWKSQLPMLAHENRICSDYDGEHITNTAAFFEAFKVEPRPGVLYRYFYNGAELKEVACLAPPKD